MSGWLLSKDMILARVRGGIDGVTKTCRFNDAISVESNNRPHARTNTLDAWRLHKSTTINSVQLYTDKAGAGIGSERHRQKFVSKEL